MISEEIKLFPYFDTFPKIGDEVFLASGVKIIGDVQIGNYSSVWYNTVIRGDVNFIRIGEFTNIQDLCMLHVTNKKYPLVIGNSVTIGHSATLHGCVLHDNCFIGMGAVLLDNSLVNKNSMVAAGAVVKEGFIVPEGKLVAGVPAKVIRDLTDDEIKAIADSALRYADYSKISVDSLRYSANTLKEEDEKS